MKSKIILASTSKYRMQLLQQLHLKFECVAPDVDERDFEENYTGPASELALKLAHEKTKSVINMGYEEHFIIGSDQTITFNDTNLGKPGSLEKNKQRLLKLQGNTHSINTGISVFYQQRWFEHNDHSQLKMKPLDIQQISNYLAKEPAHDCAGGYKVEGLGLTLFESIRTQDQTAIVGLPLLYLCKVLDQHKLSSI